MASSSVLQSNYFGSMEYAPDTVFEFPRGIPGFEAERRFAAIEIAAQRPLLYLQSLNRPDLCLLTLPARAIARGYEPQFTAEDLELLGFPPGAEPRVGEDVMCLAIVTLDEQGEAAANLLAPVVVNLSNYRALQVIQYDTAWQIRHPLPSPESASC